MSRASKAAFPTQGREFVETNPFTPHQAGTSPLEIWYSGVVNQTAYSTTTATFNQMFAYPFVVGRSGYIDRLAIEVSAGVASAVSRVGIYRPTSTSNLYPNALVVDSGEFDCSSTGVKAVSVSVYLDAGLYWFALLSGVASPGLRAIPAASCTPVLGVPTTMGSGANNFIFSGKTYGALPAAFDPSFVFLANTTRFVAHLRWLT